MQPRCPLLFFIILILAIFLGAGCVATPANNSSVVKIPSPTTPTVTPEIASATEMKTIGILGGVGWSSTVDYYRYLNEMANERLGGDHSAKIILYSIEFGEFSKQERLAEKGDWNSMNATLVDAGRRLKAGGADFIIVASNTLNSRDDLIESETGVPVLSIIDATGREVNRSGLHTVALLGTKYTMEQDFYQGTLEKKYGVHVITPNATERDYINQVIFDELVNNNIRNESRAGYVKIINRLVKEEGAQGVILGCTEIPLLIHQDDVSVPVFDTTYIHSKAAIDYALNQSATRP